MVVHTSEHGASFVKFDFNKFPETARIVVHNCAHMRHGSISVEAKCIEVV